MPAGGPLEDLVLPLAGPALGPGSFAREMQARLRQLGKAAWGSKAQLWARLRGAEAELEFERRRREYTRVRQQELALRAGPVETQLVPTPSPPTEEERRRHELTHLPYAAWCEDCVMTRTKDDPHNRATV